MIALLRKDRDWLLISLAIGTLLAFLFFSALGFEDLFVFVSGWHLRPLAEVAWIPAVLLAVFVALREDLYRTREYLLHRPVTRAQAFLSRALAGAAVVVLWTLLGIGLLFLRELVFGKGLACAQWGRAAGGLASITAHELACYALALFAVRFPASWRARIVVGAAGWFLVQAVHLALGAARDWGRVFGADHVLGLLVLFVLFLAGATVGEREGKDLDRPVSARALIRIAPLAVLFLFVAGTVGASSWQESWFGQLVAATPVVVEVEPGELSLAGPLERDGTRALLDPDHRPTGRKWTQDGRIAQVREMPERIWDLSWFEARFVGRWDGRTTSTRVGNWGRREVELLSPELVRIVDIDWRQESRRCWLLPHPEGGTFSTDARVFETREEPVMIVADAESGAIWRVTEDFPPRLIATPLPQGDRYRAGDHAVVLGERGAWTWKSGAWETASPELLEHARMVYQSHTSSWIRLDGRPQLEVVLLDDDPLVPEAEVRAPDGTTLRHRFLPRTAREKVCAAGVILGSLLRPAPAELYSALDPEMSDRAPVLTWLVDPVLSGRGWLLPSNLLVHGALGALAVLVLRRRGARGARAFGWGVAVFLCGVLGLFLLRLVETRRAWAQPVAPAVRPALIRSA